MNIKVLFLICVITFLLVIHIILDHNWGWYQARFSIVRTTGHNLLIGGYEYDSLYNSLPKHGNPATFKKKDYVKIYRKLLLIARKISPSLYHNDDSLKGKGYCYNGDTLTVFFNDRCIGFSYMYTVFIIDGQVESILRNVYGELNTIEINLGSKNSFSIHCQCRQKD